MSSRRVDRVAANAAGRDFVVGDVHGCFRTLDRALAEVRFDAGCDRLFGFGGLVARGPHSAEALVWIERRFEAVVMGNHERPLLYWFDPSGRRRPRRRSTACGNTSRPTFFMSSPPSMSLSFRLLRRSTPFRTLSCPSAGWSTQDILGGHEPHAPAMHRSARRARESSWPLLPGWPFSDAWSVWCSWSISISVPPAWARLARRFAVGVSCRQRHPSGAMSSPAGMSLIPVGAVPSVEGIETPRSPAPGIRLAAVHHPWPPAIHYRLRSNPGGGAMNLAVDGFFALPLQSSAEPRTASFTPFR